MTAIPGWAYLASGLAITFFSKWVEAKSKPGELALFFWIGILFIIIGVWKIIYKYIFRKEKNSLDKSNNSHQSSFNNQFNSANHSNKAHVNHHSNSHHSNAMHHPNATQNTSTIHNSNNTTNHHNHTAPTLSHYHNAKVNNAVNKNQNFSSTSPVITKANSPQHVSIISCPFCGTKHYDYANFCMKCGKKLKL
jgi:cytoskeletal protein RodZ